MNYFGWMQSRHVKKRTMKESISLDTAMEDLERHDRRYHPKGWHEGQSCAYRDALSRQDDADRLDAAERSEKPDRSWAEGLTLDEVKGTLKPIADVFLHEYLIPLFKRYSKVRDEGVGMSIMTSIGSASVDPGRLFVYEDMKERASQKKAVGLLTGIGEGVDKESVMDSYEGFIDEVERLGEVYKDLENDGNMARRGILNDVMEGATAKVNKLLEDRSVIGSDYLESVRKAKEAISAGSEELNKEIGRVVRSWERMVKDAQGKTSKLAERYADIAIAARQMLDSDTFNPGRMRELQRLMKEAAEESSDATYNVHEIGFKIHRAVEDHELTRQTAQEKAAMRERWLQNVKEMNGRLFAELGEDENAIRAKCIGILTEKMGGRFKTTSETAYAKAPIQILKAFATYVTAIKDGGAGQAGACENGGTISINANTEHDRASTFMHESAHAVLDSLGVVTKSKYIKIGRTRVMDDRDTSTIDVATFDPILDAAKEETEKAAKTIFGNRWKTDCSYKSPKVSVHGVLKDRLQMVARSPDERMYGTRGEYEESRSDYESRYREGRDGIDSMVASVADVMCAATNGNQFYGHAQSYYKDNYNTPLHETVADITSLICRWPEVAKEVFPKTSSLVRRYVYGMDK